MTLLHSAHDEATQSHPSGEDVSRGTTTGSTWEIAEIKLADAGKLEDAGLSIGQIVLANADPDTGFFEIVNNPQNTALTLE